MSDSGQMESLVNPRFVEALAFAHGAAAQARKGTDFPYVVHPTKVAEVLDRFGFGDDVVIAGLLHDTLEDAGIERETLATHFNERIADLVVRASEPEHGTAAWRTRKEHTLAALAEERDPDVLALVAADKLDNVRSISDTLRHEGETKTWSRFTTNSRADQHWYYRGIAETLLNANPESRLFRTLDYETQTIFPDRRRTTPFFAGKPLGTPHDARAYLADPIRHWRPDHSALELATSWIGAGDIPADVRRVLDSDDAYRGCTLLEGFFEREVELGSKGRPSQTDLLALVKTKAGLAVIAVEGKAREPFGQLVSEWNDGPGKQERLDKLCADLGLDPGQTPSLRYQLLHRTVSAILEARRYGADDALMLVHSFDPGDASFDAYREFAEALGVSGLKVNAITTGVRRHDVELRLGWVKAR